MANLRFVVLGLLMLLAIFPLAALGGGLPGLSARALGLFGLMGEILLVPAFFFVAGAAMTGADPTSRSRLSLAGAGLLTIAATAAAFPGGLRWAVALGHAAPALRLLLLPVVYAALLPPARRVSAATALIAAILLHVEGVVVGGIAGALLAPAPYFVGGALLASRKSHILSFLRREPEFAAACGPIVLALGLIVAARAPLGAATIAAVGPVALPLGFAAGLGLIASAWTLSATAAAGSLASLGRHAGIAAVGWSPLFFLTRGLVDKGAAPNAASLVLLALSSLLALVVAADLAHDAVRRLWRTDSVAAQSLRPTDV